MGFLHSLSGFFENILAEEELRARVEQEMGGLEDVMRLLVRGGPLGLWFSSVDDGRVSLELDSFERELEEC